MNEVVERLLEYPIAKAPKLIIFASDPKLASPQQT